MPTATEIGEKIKQLRVEKGLTQQELAQSIGTTAQAISNYESGIRVPRDSQKIRLVEVLGGSIENIFFET